MRRGGSGWLASRALSSGAAKPQGKREATLRALLRKSLMDRSSLQVFMRHLWPKNSTELKVRTGVAMALLVGGKLLNVQVPYMFKLAIDTMSVASTEPILVVPTALFFGYGAARLGSALFNELRGALFAKVGLVAVRVLSRDTFLHILQLDNAFHADRSTGGLLRAVDRGTKGISQVMSSLLFHFIPTVLEIGLVCGIFAYSFGTSFAATTLGTVALYSAFTLGVTQWRNKFRRHVNQFENDAAAKSTDSLLNLETVKSFTNELREAQKFEESLRNSERFSLKVSSSLSVLNFGQQAIFSVALAGLTYMGAKGVAAGTMSVGDLVLVNGLLFQLSIPLNFLGMQYRELRQALIDMEVMFDLLRRKSRIEDAPNAIELRVPPTVRGTIAFDKVSFGYEAARPILANVSFSTGGVRQTAIVGSSGSGKSTLLKLLFRFHDVDSGEISINGVPIRSATVKSLRESIALIPQDTVLFNDTIRHNIAYGKLDATDEEVSEAAKKANIHDAIMSWPDGYSTVVGERGLKISGGEKQRVAIARAILKNAPVILMDEATSALDSETERRIVETMESAFGDRTIVVIAHRIATIVNSDRIVVLGELGQVEDEGTHTELLARRGRYARLWDQQHAPPAPVAGKKD